MTRCKMKKRMRMLREKRGATFIPVRLVMSIVIIVAISGLFYAGLKYWMPLIEEKKMDRQVNEINAMFQEMVKGSARNVALGENYKEEYGERRKFEFDLPSKLVYLGLGVDPDPFNNGSLRRGITGDGSIIVYKIEGRSKKVYWTDENIKLRLGEYKNKNWVIKDPPEGLILKGGGVHKKVIFELVEYHDKKYILIYANNSNTIPYMRVMPSLLYISNPSYGESLYEKIVKNWKYLTGKIKSLLSVNMNL